VDADARERAHFGKCCAFNTRISGGFVVRRDGLANICVMLVLIAGQPLDQPVVRLGPFVMNTEEEAQQAMRDFRTFSNGFERARGWGSEIGRSSI
jgi:hypothetical protein